MKIIVNLLLYELRVQKSLHKCVHLTVTVQVTAVQCIILLSDTDVLQCSVCIPAEEVTVGQRI